MIKNLKEFLVDYEGLFQNFTTLTSIHDTSLCYQDISFNQRISIKLDKISEYTYRFKFTSLSPMYYSMVNLEGYIPSSLNDICGIGSSSETPKFRDVVFISKRETTRYKYFNSGNTYFLHGIKDKEFILKLQSYLLLTELEK